MMIGIKSYDGKSGKCFLMGEERARGRCCGILCGMCYDHRLTADSSLSHTHTPTERERQRLFIHPSATVTSRSSKTHILTAEMRCEPVVLQTS